MTTQRVRDHRRYAEPGTTQKLRVATYTRTNTSGDRSISLDAQETRLRDHINLRDWNLVATYTDQGCGGATRQRTGLGLQQALADARDGRFDMLLVDSLDRLARSTSGLADVLRQLEAAGVTCQSRVENFDTANPVDRLQVRLLEAYADFDQQLRQPAHRCESKNRTPRTGS